MSGLDKWHTRHEEAKDLTLKTTCHCSRTFATVPHQPEALGTPQCKHRLQMAGPQPSLQSQKAVVTRQFKGQGNQALTHCIWASYSLLAATKARKNGRTKRGKIDQAQRTGRARPARGNTLPSSWGKLCFVSRPWKEWRTEKKMPHKPHSCSQFLQFLSVLKKRFDLPEFSQRALS